MPGTCKFRGVDPGEKSLEGTLFHIAAVHPMATFHRAVPSPAAPNTRMSAITKEKGVGMSSANKGQAVASSHGREHVEEEEERIVPPLWYIDFGTSHACANFSRTLHASAVVCTF